MKRTPAELLEAFNLLKVETSLELDAPNRNEYQLADFPRIFRDALIEGLSKAPELKPADWLARDIIDLKLEADPANSLGLGMILEAFTAAVFDNNSLSFGDWLNSWFEDDGKNHAAFSAFLKLDDLAPRRWITHEDIKQNAEENENLATILLG